ncbi:MAG: universal stress protein [Neptuniibacter sp.]
METILVNLDLKHDPTMLLEKAAVMAKQYGASLELFCCCYNRSITHGYLFDKEQEAKAEHAYMRQMEEKLEKLTLPLIAQGIEVGFDVAWNRHRGEGVVRQVLRHQPDMLLHAIQPHNRLGHYLFASVDWQIARKCPVPVLFIKDRPWNELTRITACIDPLHEGDEHAKLDKEIMAQSFKLAKEGLGELRVLHCYNTLPHEAIFDEHLITDYDALQVKVEQLHLRRCNLLLEEYGLNTDSYQVDMLKGETDLTISNYAKHNEIDIITMGAVARSVIDRLLVGSTIEHVVDHVDCDVLLVKPEGFICPVPD